MRSLILLCTLAIPSWGWEFTYGATTAGAPTWNRPTAALDGLSFVGFSVPYQVQAFVAPQTGTYTITSLATGGWDNFLVLYQGAFNAASPLTNAIAANDDFGFIGQSRIVQSLTAGTTYRVVTSGFWNFSNGAFSNTISTPTPEPSTWLMLAVGLALLTSRGRWRVPVLARAPSRR